MKKQVKHLLFMLCLSIILVGCGKSPKLENGEEVIAELNGKQLTANELYEDLKDKYGTSTLIGLIDNYITEKETTDEISKKAKELGKSDYDSYYAKYKNSWADFLSYYGYQTNEQFQDSLVNNHKQTLVLRNYLKTTVTDKDIESYYKDSIFGEITARHILIIPSVTEGMNDEQKTKAKEEALKKANDLIEKLKNSTNLEEDFTNLAKEHSNDEGTAKEGGLISNFTNDSGLVKEFWDASLKLSNGEFTKSPVESVYGYHIIYKVSQKDKPSLENVKDKVIDKIVSKALESENANYIHWDALRKKYELKIHDSKIEDSYKSTQKGLK